MKTILTAAVLMAAIPVFSESSPQPAPVTNSVVSTNTAERYKPAKASPKADAYTGATRRAKKEK